MGGAAGSNVFTQAAGGLQQAGKAAASATGYTPQQVSATNVGTKFGYAPDMVAAQRAAGGMANYANPYTQQVIDTSMADLERQRQMQQNQIGTQATQAGAFGGSRHGVAEALTNEAFARQGGQLAAGLRQQGFNTALGASQQDVANAMQAALANQSANAAAQQFGQSSTLAAQQANQSAALQAALANQQAGLNANQQRLGAAGQLSNIANLGFGMGQSIQQQQMQQGAQQQAMQQALIDSARQQYAGWTGQPGTSLGYLNQAIGVSPAPMSQTNTRQPGLFDYLTMAAQAVSGTNFNSDPRLKTNVQHKGQFNGVNFYSWDWNDEGKRVANPAQPTFGVMADELQKTHPQHVSRGEDGYLQVHYADLMRELVEAA